MGREEGPLASGAAGLRMTGFIADEVVMLRQGSPWALGLYGGLGLLIAEALSIALSVCITSMREGK